MRHHLLLSLCLLSTTACPVGAPLDSASPEGGPTAVARAAPDEGTVPLTVTLDGRDSVAGELPIASYQWQLPDGEVVTGELVEATLVEEGSWTITLTVEDDGGLRSEASVEVAAACPELDEATVAGNMSWGEVSGLAAASTDGYLWGHSDAQGPGAVVYAFSTSAVLQGSFTLDGISDYDWEDIARGPCLGGAGSCIYVADTGDNAETRRSIQIVRFEEPTALDGGTITGAESFSLTYEGGARDAETLMVDPLTGDLMLVERDRDDLGESGIYYLEGPLGPDSGTELARVGQLTFGTEPLDGDVDATGGDISPDGRLVAVRTHDRVWLFARDPALPAYTAFDNPVCSTPVVDEAKGEALGFALDGSGYFTGGEGNNQPLHWFGMR